MTATVDNVGGYMTWKDPASFNPYVPNWDSFYPMGYFDAEFMLHLESITLTRFIVPHPNVDSKDLKSLLMYLYSMAWVDRFTDPNL